MKTYQITIKSHCEAPDYENECQAKSIKEAAEIFSERLSRGYESWYPEQIINHIEEL